MKNEDKVYLYSDGSMCRVINENDKTVKQVDHFVIRENLKILGSYNGNDNRMCFVLKDDNNIIYYMSQDNFNRYVDKHDLTLCSEFEFVRDGKIQSIKEVEQNNEWISLREKQPELELCMDAKEVYFISKPLRIKTYVGCEFIGRHKITFATYDFPINCSVFIIYGLNEDATLDYDKVQYWKEIEE